MEGLGILQHCLASYTSAYSAYDHHKRSLSTPSADGPIFLSRERREEVVYQHLKWSCPITLPKMADLLHPKYASDKPEGSRQLLRPRTPQDGESSDGVGSDAGRRSPAIAYTVTTPGDALHSATDRGDLNGIARILRASPDCIDAPNNKGRTPLHVASQIGRNDIVKHLLQNGADVNARSGWKYTPLIFAAENVHPEVVLTLVHAGAELEAKTKHGNTALHRAVRREKNNPDTVYLLAVLGADVNTRNDKGHTAIYTTVAENQYLNALTLCAFGALPKNKRFDEQSGFHLAISQRQDPSQPFMDKMVTLFTRTLSFEVTRYRQQLVRFISEEKPVDLLAVLCWASGKGHLPVVEFILELSGEGAASIIESFETSRGWKPLHYAAMGGERGTAKLLMDYGATVDCLTKRRNWTPLLMAAEKGRQRTVRYLLESGADILAESHDGRTSFELARDGRHTSTLEVLGEFANRLEDTKRRQLAVDRFIATSRGTAPITKDSLESGDGKGNNAIPIRLRKTPQQYQGRDTDKEEGQSKPDESSSSTREDTGETPPTNTIAGIQDSFGGSFDGGLYSDPANRYVAYIELHFISDTNLHLLTTISSELSQSRAFEMLIGIWEYFDFKQKHDQPIKVAIIDTGLDLSHSDWVHPRTIRFQNGRPIRAEGEPRQCDRVRACKDFTGYEPGEGKDAIIDLDGHGTQVAGLVLRLAPRSSLYIARICEGNIHRGAVQKDDVAPTQNRIKNPKPEIAAAAIDWAIEQKVDIINMSFGFSFRLRGHLKDALKRARQANILVFAAMSNDGNNSPYGAAWPASDSSITLGIHSSQEGGRRSSGFTPPPALASHNFMVPGERVITHWPESKGGGYRLDDGTSYATPVAVAMAALILGFTRQHMCKREREETQGLVDLDEMREVGGMGRVLQRISVPDETGGYSYIHPRLLWKDFNPALDGDRGRMRKHAWDIIQDALSR